MLQRRAYLATLALVAVIRCGGVGVDAEVAPTPPPSKCQSPRALMREFYTLLDRGEFAGLKTVLERDVLAATTEYFSIYKTNPLFMALGVVMPALAEWAGDPPETTTGQLCLDRPPDDLSQGNRLCRVRRLLTTLLAEDKAAVLLDEMRPVVVNLLKYVEGTIPDSNGQMREHYELVRVIHRMAFIGGRCDPANTYALLEALLGYLTPQKSRELLDNLRAIVRHPAIRKMLTTYETDGKVGVRAYVTLADLLVRSVFSMPQGPTYFRDTANVLNLLIDFADGLSDDGPALADMLRRTADGLSEMMNPANGILRATQNLIDCIWAADPPARREDGGTDPEGATVYAALYNLFLDANVLDIPHMLDAMAALVVVDPSGEASLSMGDVLALFSRSEDAQIAVNALLEALLRDETDSPPPGNARLIVPILRVMVERKVLEELGALMQQILYSCDPPQ